MPTNIGTWPEVRDRLNHMLLRRKGWQTAKLSSWAVHFEFCPFLTPHSD
jgi:hypothetical protein